jgi:hypothetical protein
LILLSAKYYTESDEIMRVANVIIEEKELAFIDNGQAVCDVCGKRHKMSGLNTQNSSKKKIIKWELLLI